MNRIIYLFLMLIINSQLLADFVKPAEIEIIASHFSFTEGPACDQQGNLYFSDLKERRIYKISANGKKSIFLDIKLKTNGLMFHRNGMLYACVTHPDAKRKIGSLISINPENKRITTIASTYKGKAFNRLNDLVIDKSGGVYFTDIIPGKKGRGQKKAGIYYCSAKGKVTKLVDSNNKPNGILLSVDETVLYVVMSADEGLMSYKVKSPGVIAKGKVFFKTEIPAGQRKPSYGDGLACDKSGNLYVTVPSAKRLQVISPKGKLLAYINCHTVPANCCFGGTDNQYLYVTAGSEILKIKTPIKGHVFQRD